MSSLIVPRLDEEPWPTLGPQVCDFLEERAVFGPGSLQGEPARLSPEKRAIVFRAYELFPRGHVLEGRRRFKRVAWSVRKGMAKTELLAWVAYAELHPEAEVRFDGWDANGDPVGRPVAAPYIPLLAYSKDQSEELAYGALLYVVTEGPDADMFDAGLDRVIRLDVRGRADGRAVPLAGSPNAVDGARTTFQGFDEPHRLYLPRLHEAHRTMTANLPKRPAEDAWSLYVGTAGELGQGSIQENLHAEAEKIGRGEIKDPRIFYFHRDAGSTHRGDKDATGHDLTSMDGRLAAIREATGPDGEYGPGQFADIAEQWDRDGADVDYLERVWLNLWIRSGRQAFDVARLPALTSPGRILPGSFVTAGFDGARFRDSTGIVVTDIPTGRQMAWGLWERPYDLDPGEPWEVDEASVTASVASLMATFRVWRFNGDPPYWTETLGAWAGRWACVEEWWTHRRVVMYRAAREYREALTAGTVTFVEDGRAAAGSSVPGESYADALARHIGNTGKVPLAIHDPDTDQPMWIPGKIHPERKFDLAMAAILSWQGRLDAIRKAARPTPNRTSTRVRRVNR